MNRDELIALYPRLFHMAEAGSWPTIRDFGLMPTERLVRTSSLSPADQSALLDARRPASVTVPHPRYGDVVIRDQGPLRTAALEKALTDMTVEEWLHTLNNRVFFWLHPERLEELLTAQRYRNSEQDVLTVDTRSLLEAAGDHVRLSSINSGATLYIPSPRGSDTFRTVEDYPYAQWRKKRPARNAIVELAVLGGVPDIARHVIEVRRMKGTEVLGDYDLA